MTSHAYARGPAASLERIDVGADLHQGPPDHAVDALNGFREAFNRMFGDRSGQRRADDAVTVTWFESTLGPLVAGATDAGVCFLEFSDWKRLESQLVTLRRRVEGPIVPGAHRHLDQLEGELAAYLAGNRRAFSVPLVFPGTPFQVRVWEALLTIPYGDRWSYERLARTVGAPAASRAVGHANGQNRIAIVIPCHRVVNKDGKLGGYGGGLWRKQRLLELETMSGSLFSG